MSFFNNFKSKYFDRMTAYNPNGKMECRKRLAWTIACERAVVTKEDAVQIYNKVMKEFETIDKRQKYKERESNKTQAT